MTTETLDKLYLEWSKYTHARTARELRLRKLLEKIKSTADAASSDAYPEHIKTISALARTAIKVTE